MSKTDYTTTRRTFMQGFATAVALQASGGDDEDDDGLFSWPEFEIFGPDMEFVDAQTDQRIVGDPKRITLGETLSWQETADGLHLAAPGTGLLSETVGGEISAEGRDLRDVREARAEMLQADAATIGETVTRDLVDNEAVNIVVPDDYSTVQDAVDALVALDSRYEIDINVQTDTNEDLYIPECLTRQVPQDESTETSQIQIIGDNTFPAVNSIHVDGVHGNGLQINNLTVAGTNPRTNENSAVEVYGGNANLVDLDVTANCDTAVTCYASTVTVDNLACSGTVRDAVAAKHTGRVMVEDDMTGSVDRYWGRANGGFIVSQIVPSGTASGDAAGRTWDVPNGAGYVATPSRTYGVTSPVYRKTTQDLDGGNTIDAPSGFIRVTDGTGYPATLTTINGGEHPQEITLEFGGETTVEDSTGNIRLDGGTNWTSGSTRDKLRLMKQDFGDYWVEISSTNT